TRARADPFTAIPFPRRGPAEGATAPTILNAPGLGAAGSTKPFETFDAQTHTPGVATLRGDSQMGGFNVVTWDPRGEYASGGTYQLNDPFLDGVDVRSIVTWVSESTPTTLNGSLDPAVGMAGGSSGGEIQLVSAGIDPRIDAIVPSTTWNSLIDSLFANGTVNVPVATRLLSAMTKPGVRLSPQLRSGLKNGIASGRLSDATLTQLADKNASTLLGQLQAPTLLWQSTADPLFSLQESMDTAVSILGNPYGVPVKMAWFDGSTEDAAVIEMINDYTLAWLSKYVKGTPIPDAYFPAFQWLDQTGTRYTSTLLPVEPGFNSPDIITATSTGGRLPVGSSCSKPVSGLRVQANVPEGAQIVGVPTLTVGYRGRGKGQALCIRVTDLSTGKVVSSPVTMLPLILDGKRKTDTMELNGLAFTGLADSRLVVTVWGMAQSGVKPASVDVNVSELQVSFAQHARQ
ncbi:MAG: alpha/beta hydrolase family protein, partial [bacterium]